MIKLIFINLILIAGLGGCTSYKSLKVKDAPKQNNSFAVISFLNYGTEINKIKTGFFNDKKEPINFTNIEWDFNKIAQDRIKNSLIKKGLIIHELNYSRSWLKNDPNFSLKEIIKTLKENNKILPDYYLVLIPYDQSSAKTYGMSDDGFDKFDPPLRLLPLSILAIPFNPLLPFFFSSIAIDHQYIKYHHIKLNDDPFYKNSKEFKDKINVRIESVNNKKTQCSMAFGLFIIDGNKEEIIAFAAKNFFKNLNKQNDWSKVNSFSDFTQVQQNEIKEECVEIFKKALDVTQNAIGIDGL